MNAKQTVSSDNVTVFVPLLISTISPSHISQGPTLPLSLLDMMLVDKVMGAIRPMVEGENSMKYEEYDDLEKDANLDHEMSLIQYQKDIKLEAIACRDFDKYGSCPKKSCCTNPICSFFQI